MEKIEQLLAQLEAVDKEIDGILANDELTDELRARHAALVADREKLIPTIQRAQEQHNRDAERKRLIAEADEAKALALRVAVAPKPRLTTPDVPNPKDVPALRSDNGLLRSGIPATAKRYGPIKNFRGTRNGMGADERAYRFGMWVLAAVTDQMPGRFRFKAAQEYVNKYMAAATAVDGTTGYSYLIPEEFGMDLIDLRELYGVVRRLFKAQPMTSDTRTDPRRQGGLTAYFVQEGAQGTESNKSWNDVRLTAKDLMVLSRYTNQLNADAAINIGDDLAGEIAYAFSNKEDDCGFNGNGTSTYGGIYGLRVKLDDVLMDGSGTDSAGLIVATGNASWGALTMLNFLTVVGTIPQYAAARGLAWVCHRAFWASTMVRLELAQGGTTMTETRQGDTAPRPLFLGYPVEFAQIFPGTSASAQVCALLGNYELAASFGDRQQDNISFSEHATIGGENVFERNQIAIRGTERFDINCHDVGSTTAAGPVCGLKTG